MPERPLLSLCMIVRDEERNLPRCLASVQGVCDEMVVVDTGSRDRTPEIARAFGAAVHSRPWRNDFAAARNHALDLAGGQWVLCLDADEELHPEDRRRLDRLLAVPGVEGYICRIHNFTGRLEDGAVEVSAGLRLFRNRPEYRWSGALHEQIGEAILRRCPGSLAVGGPRILHYGYLDEVTVTRAKRERNLAIARDLAASRPEDAFTLFNLGIEYHRLRRWEEALAAYRRAERRMTPGATWGGKLYKAMTLVLAHLGRPEEALATAGRGLAAYPDYTDLVHVQGVILLVEKRLPRAIAAFRQCLAMGDAPVPPHAAADLGMGGARAWFALGMAYEDCGHLVEAIEAYQQAYVTGGNRVGPLYRIAAIAVPRESPAAVRAYFERFFDLADPAHLLTLAHILQAAGGTALALPYLDRAERAGADGAAVAALRALCQPPAAAAVAQETAPAQEAAAAAAAQETAPAAAAATGEREEEEKRVARQAHRGSRLSVCLIVRDEEEDLPRCLASVAAIADELVVVDTGSTDRTAAIARSFGARVHAFPWTGHFGAARNHALDLAGGDWILFLDADEEVHPDDRPLVRDLMRDRSLEGHFLRIVNYFGPAPGVDAATDLRLCLFRNRPDYRFHQPIHEDISGSIRAARPAAGLGIAAVRILHYGYLDGHLARKGKGRRNREIIARALAAAPEDPFLRYCLAAELMEQGDFQGARRELHPARDAWADGDPHLPDVIRKLALCELALGRHDAALAVLADGLARYPDFTDLVYLRGAIRHQMGQTGKAAADFRRCLEMGEAPPRYASWVGVGGFRARAALDALAKPGFTAPPPGSDPRPRPAPPAAGRRPR